MILLRRLVALCIDATTCLLLYALLHYGCGFDRSKLFVLFVLLGWLLFVLPTISRGAGSFGLRCMGLGVADLSGQRVHVRRASCRALLSLLSLALFGMGYALMFLTPRRQTLHDLFTKTQIVRDTSLPPLTQQTREATENAEEAEEAATEVFSEPKDK
ncbi:MAG: RDD family protein [Bilophila sp.]